MICDYDDMMLAIKKRIDDLNATYESVEVCCGLPDRYLGKLLGDSQTKKISAINLFNLLQTLGLAIDLRPENSAKVIERLQIRAKPAAMLDGFSIPFKKKHLQTLTKEFGSIGGRNSGKKRKAMDKGLLKRVAQAGGIALWARKRKIAEQAQRRREKRELKQARDNKANSPSVSLNLDVVKH